MFSTVTKYIFWLVLVMLVLVYFKGSVGILGQAGTTVSNLVGLLQGRRADGNGIIEYAK